MNIIKTIKSRRYIRIYNHSGSSIGVPLYASDNRTTRNCAIEGAKNGKPGFIDITWDDICYMNDTTNVIKNGAVRFDMQDEKAIYEELGILDWENILFDEVIEDIILHPTMEKLQKFIALEDIHSIERVRGKLNHFINNGVDISTRTIEVINGRFKEFNRGKRKSEITLVPIKDIKPVDQEEVDTLKSEIETLKEMVAQLANRNNFNYVEYAEIGTSDSIDLRPKMLQLLKDIENGVYDAVCVVDYDRLGRGDLGEQDRIKKAFQHSETLIITPEKVYDLNNDLDDTYADFKGLFARQEYKMITKRLRQGKKIGARRGDWTNGTPPFPYEYERYNDKYNKKSLVVNDEHYKLYREIIDMALNGESPNKVALSLNNRGI